MITQLGVHLMNTPPCILHMENQNGIKLLTSMIFIEDLSNAKKKLLYTDVNAEGVRVSQVVTNVENIINQSMIGSEDDLCQWMCPFDHKTKKEIGSISTMLLKDFSTTDQARASLWTMTLNNYRRAMILLTKQGAFRNTKIVTYQHHADRFF